MEVKIYDILFLYNTLEKQVTVFSFIKKLVIRELKFDFSTLGPYYIH